MNPVHLEVLLYLFQSCVYFKIGFVRFRVLDKLCVLIPYQITVCNTDFLFFCRLHFHAVDCSFAVWRFLSLV